MRKHVKNTSRRKNLAEQLIYIRIHNGEMGYKLGGYDKDAGAGYHRERARRGDRMEAKYTTTENERERQAAYTSTRNLF